MEIHGSEVWVAIIALTVRELWRSVRDWMGSTHRLRASVRELSERVEELEGK